MGHFKSLSAVFPVITKSECGHLSVLLHKRQNTGYQDGRWDISGSGHVDEGETATAAVVRECKEELGIRVNPSDLAFAHVSHRLGADRTYYDLYFIVKAYADEPSVAEPEKCSALGWFDVKNLPDDMIECRRADLEHCLSGIYYSEKIEDKAASEGAI